MNVQKLTLAHAILIASLFFSSCQKEDNIDTILPVTNLTERVATNTHKTTDDTPESMQSLMCEGTVYVEKTGSIEYDVQFSYISWPVAYEKVIAISSCTTPVSKNGIRIQVLRTVSNSTFMRVSNKFPSCISGNPTFFTFPTRPWMHTPTNSKGKIVIKVVMDSGSEFTYTMIGTPGKTVQFQEQIKSLDFYCNLGVY
jgi:uncharacterized Fe-S cluster protein YjdI